MGPLVAASFLHYLVFLFLTLFRTTESDIGDKVYVQDQTLAKLVSCVYYSGCFASLTLKSLLNLEYPDEWYLSIMSLLEKIIFRTAEPGTLKFE